MAGWSFLMNISKKWPDAKDAIDDFTKKKVKVKLEELTNRGFIIK